MSARAALDELDINAVLAAFRDQEERYGHTAESDGELALGYFRGELISRAQALDVIFPGERQRLDVGYIRAAQLAALAIATMRRIRREQATCPHPIGHWARRNADGATICAACNTAIDPLTGMHS